nr:unnamed protein product [Callosobruchus chinensis]
MREGVRQK